MRVIYTSPAVNAKFLVPEAAVKTYQRRDVALLKLQALGGIHAPDTLEVRKLRNTMLAARRKIQREQWFCTRVEQ